jgi:hypothetical protein
MRLVVADLESFYDPKNVRGDKKADGSPDPYTLRSMTTEAYCRDKRFEMHGIAIKWDAKTNPVWYDEREFRYIAKEENWSEIFLISHHAAFDHLVLSHHYDVHPKMSGCTMSQARLMLGNHIGVSLDSVRSQFGIPAKTTPYNLMEGRHWSEMDQATRQLVADGAIDEVNSIWRIFGILMQQGFPVEELDIIDSTIKMFSEPELRGDNAVFARVWENEVVRKQALLERLGVTKEDLGSNERFISLLLARGVEPEYKPGKPNADGSEKLIPAFAKTDPFMEELQQHEDDEVRALAEARLGTKSTLLQTRAETLGWMASRGPLCVYLRYCGAHTSRWSGGDDTNFQNWTNGHEINSAVVAPDGYLIAEPDASQIECRLLNFCAGQWDKVQEFRSGADPYIAVASAFYGFPVNKKDHPDERQLGKIVELQAGYMSGGNKIRSTVRVKSGGKLILTPAQGVQARDAYRNTHPEVVEYWNEAGRVIVRMANFESFDWGPFRIRCDAATGKRRIVLPNGIELKYDTLEYFSDPDSGDRYWRLKTRRGWVKIYSGKLVENIIQALARVVVSQAMLRLKKLGYRCKNTKHDSLWLLIPKDDRLEQHKEIILREMSRTPEWLSTVPLAAEFKGIGERMTW